MPITDLQHLRLKLLISHTVVSCVDCICSARDLAIWLALVGTFGNTRLHCFVSWPKNAQSWPITTGGLNQPLCWRMAFRWIESFNIKSSHKINVVPSCHWPLSLTIYFVVIFEYANKLILTIISLLKAEIEFTEERTKKETIDCWNP